MFRIDPINETPDTPEDEHAFPCACGDPDCIGDNEDAHNIRIGKAWYAADCVMAKNHPEVVRSRELDAVMDRSRR